MRYNLLFETVHKNCSRLAIEAYDAAISNGKSVKEAQIAAHNAYKSEMDWYESDVKKS